MKEELILCGNKTAVKRSDTFEKEVHKRWGWNSGTSVGTLDGCN
jgi:hypothetical protein